jgi:serine/threonine protein kinase
VAKECPKCQTKNPDTLKFCGECGAPLADDVVHTKTLESAEEELTTGSTFAGRYQIIEELGKGGMGRVYKVFDKEIKEKIALKLIKPEIASDKKNIERFRNELTTARKIVQKNVCRMYDLGREKDSYYITMEHISGQDLKGLIRQTGQLTVGKAISIAKQICEGLAEAHSLGVVHRDLKPNNIMIDSSGNAKIMDFGIARAVKGKSLTDSGVMIGTPQYMSPEQVEGKDVDLRSDIYSLGILLYEMLTERVPFEGETPLTVGVKQKTETPNNPKDFNERIPDDLDRLILKCLRKNREDRYQNANELKHELERLEQGLPISERVEPRKRTTASKEITVTFGWKKLMIPAAAVIVLAAVLFLVLTDRGPKLDSARAVVALFENQTGDPNFDELSKLSSDWITHGLAQTGLFSTIPITTVAVITETLTKDDLIKGLASETNSRWIITGSYYLQEDQLQFHARINDMKDERNSTSIDPVTGSRDTPMEIVDSVKQKIMGAMAFKFDPKTTELFSQFKGAPKYEAYLEFMEGYDLFMVKRNYKTAIEHYNRALDIDPTFVLPMMSMAVGYSNLGRLAESDEVLERANQYRNDFAPGDRYFLDYLRANLKGDPAEALRLIREAEKANPMYLYHRGMAAIRMNRPQEGVEAFVSIDPESPMWQGWYSYWGDLCDCYHMLGKYKKELKVARQGRQQYPDLLSNLSYEVQALAALGRVDDIRERIDDSYNLPRQGSRTPATIMDYAAWELQLRGYKESAIDLANQAVTWYKENTDRDYRSSIAWALQIAEKWDEAKQLYEELLLENPESLDYMGYSGVLAARLGEKDEALRISEELAGIDRPYIRGGHTYWRACIASLLGEKELAVKLLREALNQGQSYGRLYFDIDLMPLFDYPPFKELIKPKG